VKRHRDRRRFDSPAILGSAIHGNPGTGILVHGGAKPVIANNWIRLNGTAPGDGRPAFTSSVLRRLPSTGNIIDENAVEEIWVSPLFNAGTLFSDNIIAPGCGTVRVRSRW
jgi:hypothetical protein